MRRKKKKKKKKKKILFINIWLINPRYMKVPVFLTVENPEVQHC
jgi:hypothetical protein